MIELLLVLFILGLLVALVGPSLFQRVQPAKQSVARAQIESFGTALDAFYFDVGRFPTNAEGLTALRTKPQGADQWNGPYLKKDIAGDPWGAQYVYRAPGRSGGYEIVSLGADGKEGGEGDNADVNSWESKK